MSKIYNCKLGGECAKEQCQIGQPWQQCKNLDAIVSELPKERKRSRKKIFAYISAIILIVFVLVLYAPTLLFFLFPLQIDLFTISILFNFMVQVSIIMVLIKLLRTMKTTGGD